MPKNHLGQKGSPLLHLREDFLPNSTISPKAEHETEEVRRAANLHRIPPEAVTEVATHDDLLRLG